MKNVKKLLLTTAFATLLGVGAFAGFSASKDAKVEKADAYSQGSVIANNKARLWVGYWMNNPFFSYADADTGIRLWIHGGANNVNKIYGTIDGTFVNQAEYDGSHTEHYEGHSRYDYFDVDLSDYTDGCYVNIQKFQNGAHKSTSKSIQLSASNAFKVLFVHDDWAWDSIDGSKGTVTAEVISAVDAGLAAKALGGMHTCSSSNINGYNAFPNYNSTFVMNGENWKTSGNLSDFTVDDYATKDTSYSGSASTETNAYTKYVYVEEMYKTGGNPSFAPIVGTIASNSNNTTAIILASSVALVGATGFIFLKKKRISK